MSGILNVLVLCLSSTKTSTDLILAQVTGATLMSEQSDFSQVGLGDTSHIERGERACTPSGKNDGAGG